MTPICTFEMITALTVIPLLNHYSEYRKRKLIERLYQCFKIKFASKIAISYYYLSYFSFKQRGQIPITNDANYKNTFLFDMHIYF